MLRGWLCHAKWKAGHDNLRQKWFNFFSFLFSYLQRKSCAALVNTAKTPMLRTPSKINGLLPFVFLPLKVTVPGLQAAGHEGRKKTFYACDSYEDNMITSILPVLQTLLAFCNLCVLGFALFRFLNKPHDTLEQQHKELEKRVDAHDLVLKDIEKSLDSSHEKHRFQNELNEVFMTSMLAFIDFEFSYCEHTGYEFKDDLLKAKKTLIEYLARCKHG